MDVFKVADILVEDVKAKYGNEIAIVAFYGSYARGTATERSDLDFFFIPDCAEGMKASFQFVLEGIGFDFWPINWERAERMASFQDGKVAVIADSKVLYARSDADLERFNRLKDQTAAMCQPDNRATMLDQALSCLKDGYVHLHTMQLAGPEQDLAATRMDACKVATAALQGLALFNQTYFTTGWGQNMDQVLALERKPEGLKVLLDCLMTSRSCAEVRRACEQLMDQTRALLVSEQALLARARTYSDVFTGFYEEAKGLFNKIVTACERNDTATAFFASLHLQDEICVVLTLAEDGVECSDLNTYGDCRKAYDSLGLPDLAGILEAGKLDVLKDAVMALDKKMRRLLETRGVRLNLFDTLDEFESFVRNKM